MSPHKTQQKKNKNKTKYDNMYTTDRTNWYSFFEPTHCTLYFPKFEQIKSNKQQNITHNINRVIKSTHTKITKKQQQQKKNNSINKKQYLYNLYVNYHQNTKIKTKKSQHFKPKKDSN